jgi:hypothetical protein
MNPAVIPFVAVAQKGEPADFHAWKLIRAAGFEQ